MINRSRLITPYSDFFTCVNKAIENKIQLPRFYLPILFESKCMLAIVDLNRESLFIIVNYFEDDHKEAALTVQVCAFHFYKCIYISHFFHVSHLIFVRSLCRNALLHLQCQVVSCFIHFSEPVLIRSTHFIFYFVYCFYINIFAMSFCNFQKEFRQVNAGFFG